VDDAVSPVDRITIQGIKSYVNDHVPKMVRAACRLSAGSLLPQEARCLHLGEHARKTASRWQGAWMSLPGQRSG
jgi:hypothetical protein